MSRAVKRSCSLRPGCGRGSGPADAPRASPADQPRAAHAQFSPVTEAGAPTLGAGSEPARGPGFRGRGPGPGVGKQRSEGPGLSR